MTILEFKVNDLISLKMDKEEVNIYLNGELFKQCKAILLNRQFNELEDLNSINSIDELADSLEHLNYEFDENAPKIPSETLFWAHCSNIQTWVESDYDTRLLHSNLAFPLLKKLADLGDARARQRFSEEVLERFNEGDEKTREYLIFEDYLQYIDDENKFLSLLNEDDALLLIEMAKKYHIEFRVETGIPSAPRWHDSYIKIKNKKLTGMGLRLKEGRTEVPKEIARFKSLKSITVYLEDINFNVANVDFLNIEGLSLIIKNSNKDVPIKINGFNRFPNLKYISISNELIYDIDILTDKQFLNKINKVYIEFSQLLMNLEYLESFYIDSLRFKTLPQFLNKSDSLKNLIIKNSEIKILLAEVLKSPHLERLTLNITNLKEIPNSVTKLKNIIYFSCEPYLITPEIKTWIIKQKLEPFGDNEFKQSFSLKFKNKKK